MLPSRHSIPLPHGMAFRNHGIAFRKHGMAFRPPLRKPRQYWVSEARCALNLI